MPVCAFSKSEDIIDDIVVDHVCSLCLRACVSMCHSFPQKCPTSPKQCVPRLCVGVGGDDEDEDDEDDCLGGGLTTIDRTDRFAWAHTVEGRPQSNGTIVSDG